MAKKQNRHQRVAVLPEPSPRPGLTAERFTRLYRLLHFLAIGPRTRDELLDHLALDVRGFYRDLEILREVGVLITHQTGQYHLSDAADELIDRLPFPDPHLSLRDIRQLARGRTRLHQQLRDQIDRLTTLPAPPAPKRR